MSFPTPDNEAGRLATLRRLAILDSAPDPAFDKITRLAKGLFDVDIALVSLVDEHRQWFKSACGFSATETGRDVAICAHAIMQQDLFIVPDASKDDRFKDNPFVTGPPHIRFYAGAPLVCEDGNTIGTLCIINSKQRKPLTDSEKDVLLQLADEVVKLIERSAVPEAAA